MFSHHSHSGEFCTHAKDTLEECIQQAINKGFKVFALTEHIPRNHVDDLYPGETETIEDLFTLFDTYHKTALHYRQKYASLITLLIGFEIDWIRDTSPELIQSIRDKYQHDYFVGSIHHVYTFPIDFDESYYQKAIDATTTRTEEGLFEDYFDDQYDMLTTLKPKVVAHFDLVRLMSSDYRQPLKEWGKVWEKVVRNVEFIVNYGGLVELNSAALRKGWESPYPGRDVFGLMVEKGVKFTLSDDSHGVEQVGFGYDLVVRYLEEFGVEKVWCYDWEGVVWEGEGAVRVYEGEAPAVGEMVLKEVLVKDIKI